MKTTKGYYGGGILSARSLPPPHRHVRNVPYHTTEPITGGRAFPIDAFFDSVTPPQFAHSHCLVEYTCRLYSPSFPRPPVSSVVYTPRAGSTAPGK